MCCYSIYVMFTPNINIFNSGTYVSCNTHFVYSAWPWGKHPQILESDWINRMEDIQCYPLEFNTFHNHYVILLTKKYISQFIATIVFSENICSQIFVLLRNIFFKIFFSTFFFFTFIFTKTWSKCFLTVFFTEITFSFSQFLFTWIFLLFL